MWSPTSLARHGRMEFITFLSLLYLSLPRSHTTTPHTPTHIFYILFILNYSYSLDWECWHFSHLCALDICFLYLKTLICSLNHWIYVSYTWNSSSAHWIFHTPLKFDLLCWTFVDLSFSIPDKLILLSSKQPLLSSKQPLLSSEQPLCPCLSLSEVWFIEIKD